MSNRGVSGKRRKVSFPLNHMDKALQGKITANQNREAEKIASSYPLPFSPEPFQPFDELPEYEDETKEGEENVVTPPHKEEAQMVTPREKTTRDRTEKKKKGEEQREERESSTGSTIMAAPVEILKKNEEMRKQIERMRQSSERELEERLKEEEKKRKIREQAKNEQIEKLKEDLEALRKRQNAVEEEAEQRERRAERKRKEERKQKEEERERQEQEREEEEKRRKEQATEKRQKRKVESEDEKSESEEYSGQEDQSSRSRSGDEHYEESPLSRFDVDAEIKIRKITEEFRRRRMGEEDTAALCSKLDERDYIELARRTLEVDDKGMRDTTEMSISEIKELKFLQAKMMVVEDRRREAVLNRAVNTIFGLDWSGITLSLPERLKFLALLLKRVVLSQIAVEAAIDKSVVAVRAQTPGIPWVKSDILNLSGAELANLRIEDVMTTPSIWKRYIAAASNQTEALRRVKREMERRYLDPIRQKRHNSMITAMGYETEEILWFVEVLLLPRPEIDNVHAVRELHETLLLRHVERLEAMRAYRTEGTGVGAAFLKLMRADPPSREKDFEKLLKEAKKERVAGVIPTSLSGSFKHIVHTHEAIRNAPLEKEEERYPQRRSVSMGPPRQVPVSQQVRPLPCVSRQRSHPTSFSRQPPFQERRGPRGGR